MSALTAFRFRVILVMWTLGIWGSRVRNIAADNELAGTERLGALGIAGVLLVAASVTGFAMWRRASWLAVPLGILVLVGVARWTVRGPLILASDDWSVGFRVVHTALWLITVVLSVAAWREHRRVGVAGSS